MTPSSFSGVLGPPGLNGPGLSLGLARSWSSPWEPPLLPPTSSKGTGWNRVPGSARSPGADIRNRRNAICGASWRWNASAPPRLVPATATASTHAAAQVPPRRDRAGMQGAPSPRSPRPPPPGLPRAPSRLPRPSRPAALFREDPHRHLIDGFSPSLRFASCQDYAAGSLSPVSVLAASRCSPGRQRRGGRPAAGSELAARRRGGRCGVLSFSLLCFRTSLSSISPALCTGARRGRTTSARTCGSGGRTGSGGPGGTGAAAGCGTCPRRPPGPSQKRRTA